MELSSMKRASLEELDYVFNKYATITDGKGKWLQIYGSFFRLIQKLRFFKNFVFVVKTTKIFLLKIISCLLLFGHSILVRSWYFGILEVDRMGDNFRCFLGRAII
mgnify:CR=1 FL=1